MVHGGGGVRIGFMTFVVNLGQSSGCRACSSASQVPVSLSISDVFCGSLHQ